MSDELTALEREMIETFRTFTPYYRRCALVAFYNLEREMKLAQAVRDAIAELGACAVAENLRIALQKFEEGRE